MGRLMGIIDKLSKVAYRRQKLQEWLYNATFLELFKVESCIYKVKVALIMFAKCSQILVLKKGVMHIALPLIQKSFS